MNGQRFHGKWEQWKGRIKAVWGRLTCNPALIDEGRRDLIAGRFRERYAGTVFAPDAVRSQGSGEGKS